MTIEIDSRVMFGENDDANTGKLGTVISKKNSRSGSYFQVRLDDTQEVVSVKGGDGRLVDASTIQAPIRSRWMDDSVGM
jgi:hypothetical protein